MKCSTGAMVESPSGVQPLPDDVARLMSRIEASSQHMVALEDDIRLLRLRLEHADLAAIHLGLRRMTEALLRHAAREEGLAPGSGPAGMLQKLRDDLRKQVGTRMDESFWAYVETIQRHVNRNAHHQADDVYKPRVVRRVDPWDEVRAVMQALASVVDAFRVVWGPPEHAVMRRDDNTIVQAARPRVGASSVADAGATGSEEGEGLEDEDDSIPDSDEEWDDSDLDADDESSDDLNDELSDSSVDLARLASFGELTVAEVRDDPDLKGEFVEASGRHPRGVTRRLNATHGKTKIRNAFSDVFGDAEEAEDEAEQQVLDYERIGNLTVKAARELGLARDVARLCGWSEGQVRRQFKRLHGASVIRRHFPWYDLEVLGEITVHAAREYRLEQLLAEALGRSRSSVAEELRATMGQTKLRTLFDELE